MIRFLSNIALWVLLCLVAVLQSKGQQTVSQQRQEIFRLQANDSINTRKAGLFAKEKISHFQHKGYLLATTDSIVRQAKEFVIYISPGTQYHYRINELVIGDRALFGAAVNHLAQSEPVSFEEFDAEAERIIDYYARKGHPFARIEKQNVQIEGDVIWLDLKVNPSEKVLFDTISIIGDANLNRHFLENFLGIEAGNLYNEEWVRGAELKLQELEYAELTGPLQLSFSPGLASLLVPLTNIPSNRFDGIAGFSGGSDPEASFQITGMLNLYLSNAMGMGEKIDMQWQSPGSGTQILSLQGSYPYPFRLPMETEMMFALHKQDSSWLQVQVKPAFFFPLSSGSKMGVFWHNTTNNLINTQIRQYPENSSPNLDFTMNLYGLEYRYSTSAYFRKIMQEGFRVNLTASAGMKSIQRNDNLPDNVYDETQMRTTRVNLLSHIEKRWQTGSRATLLVGSRSGFINGKNLPPNQLFRLGGFQTLRGFDELSLLASAYSFADVEFRFFTDPQSYFSFFTSGGWYRQASSDNPSNDFPVGFGTGINLQTRAGIFSLNLALGFKKDVSPELRNAKVHVGYISSF